MNSLKNFYKSFKYAFEGLVFCFKSEKNFRFHIFVLGLILFIMPYYQFTKEQSSIIALCFVFVLGFEIFNTVIEKIMNKVNSNYDIDIKHIKDMAAGAVLVVIFGVVFIGFNFFLNYDILTHIIKDITTSIIKSISILIYIALAIYFVFVYESIKE
ncbi:MAG: diacylglycerol kinase family protein [Oscillospiraceae bacterium]